MARYFGEPKDFASFLYASQVLQAEAVKIGVEHFRRERPRTMGTLFWQLNDCWPVASWSSIDYYGRWKALQYYATHFYAPVLVSPHIENGALTVYVVSDKTQPEQGELRLRIEHFDGTIVRKAAMPVTIAPLRSQIVFNLPLSDLQSSGQSPLDMASIFGAVDLTVGGHVVSSNVVYFAPSKQLELPQTPITTQLTQSSDGYDLKLQASDFARSVYVSFGDTDATFSDNYINLLPNEPATIHITSQASLDALKSHIKITSLADAFSFGHPQ
jgi:beta-mannosidase